MDCHQHHGLVFGASGILGWSIVDQILAGYPSKDTFHRVTALTNRPLDRGATLWPESDKLRIVSGLDINRGSQEDLCRDAKTLIEDIATVTEVYFCAYIWDANHATESAVNTEMLSRAVSMVEALAPNLRYVVLPTGTKAYGMHLVGGRFPYSHRLPLREDLPPLPEPYGSQLFYTHQIAELRRLGRNKSWKWCDVRPDFVVGFVPNKNVYCIAQILAIYLTVYASVKGSGASVAFPGTEKSWSNQFNHSSQDMTARFSIHASLHPEKVGTGKAYNVCDEETPTSWSKLWPVICAYFDLEGIGPAPNAPEPDGFMQEQQNQWKDLIISRGLRDVGAGKQGFWKMLMSDLDFDRPVDISLSRDVGFYDDIQDGRAFTMAFDRFRQARIIP